MADQYFEMTQKNYEDLKKELDYLVKEKRPEIIERIAARLPSSNTRLKTP